MAKVAWCGTCGAGWDTDTPDTLVIAFQKAPSHGLRGLVGMPKKVPKPVLSGKQQFQDRVFKMMTRRKLFGLE